jgi:hypothetical protein
MTVQRQYKAGQTMDNVRSKGFPAIAKAVHFPPRLLVKELHNGSYLSENQHVTKGFF